MKIITNKNREIEVKMLDIAFTTGGELRAQISIEPESIAFLELVGIITNKELDPFTVIRNDGTQETFEGFNKIAKVSRRINEYSNDVFVELIHKDYVVEQTDGDAKTKYKL